MVAKIAVWGMILYDCRLALEEGVSGDFESRVPAAVVGMQKRLGEMPMDVGESMRMAAGEWMPILAMEGVPPLSWVPRARLRSPHWERETRSLPQPSAAIAERSMD